MHYQFVVIAGVKLSLVIARPNLHFDVELEVLFDPAWADDIDQVILRGPFAMEEFAFFHIESHPVIVCDLIQRHPEATKRGWKGMLMRLDSLVGEHGSTPREWRANSIRRTQTRAAREEVISWKPERLLIAHGECSQIGATSIVDRALRWI